ncbi:FAD/FMN-containing oxidoreductase [Candidatus Kinetoplastibacterium blastocrithidii TCC012E]|uniref:FAD/FMN-containing oxidoreductase n=2 Tax=cellular organisms TaxID=131567 RepID=M1LVG0_9PROT|nr:FAD-binding oxidoreductase [Candidatus Kinetoplastibacterium blastocrithidii]AFZ83446.1 oxidoreductase [Candidatus Kinetoplastibacterium blastocrithidii (ex Strigomonas culicis)]AGF49542.1 FAD/FMN-containing oxidoreductase [Candidatus Kinetoplastibacterium blastocrithidii TCC012E]
MKFLKDIESLLGNEYVLTGDSMQKFLTDWRKRYIGNALAVILPRTSSDVAAIVNLCISYNVSIVPQGGNTGLCGGATPDTSGKSIVISTIRMNSITNIDIINNSITVEAGCILKNVQNAALDCNRLFPLSLASEGSCTIGGNLATNAGGTQVLRYGNIRELTLGIEFVNAEGNIVNALRGLRKDNSGYSLRDLYIGSEGTLGIITAASLKLFPKPLDRKVILVSIGSLEQAVSFFSYSRSFFYEKITAFELMSGLCIDMVKKLLDLPKNFINKSSWFVLIEISYSDNHDETADVISSFLENSINKDLIFDAMVSNNVKQNEEIWLMRESIPIAERDFGKAIKHDISVPISSIASFVKETNSLIQASFPGVQHIIFGHIGDGNLHYNIARASWQSECQLLSLQDDIYRIVHSMVVDFGGSISAEHGVGMLKVGELSKYKSVSELHMMKLIKLAIDPYNIMNPGKILMI